MFVRFTTPEGLAADLRVSRIAAAVTAEEGGTRIFLGGALSLLVAESLDEVRRLLQPAEDDD